MKQLKCENRSIFITDDGKIICGKTIICPKESEKHIFNEDCLYID